MIKESKHCSIISSLPAGANVQHPRLSIKALEVTIYKELLPRLFVVPDKHTWKQAYLYWMPTSSEVLWLQSPGISAQKICSKADTLYNIMISVILKKKQQF
jgi:hypothetical protein